MVTAGRTDPAPPGPTWDLLVPVGVRENKSALDPAPLPFGTAGSSQGCSSLWLGGSQVSCPFFLSSHPSGDAGLGSKPSPASLTSHSEVMPPFSHTQSYLRE